ncbi:MAG: hypothetical protein WCO71_13060 [Pseudomonadota bacterium]
MTDKPKITSIDDARKRGNAQKNNKLNGASSGKASSPLDAYERALRKQKGGGGAFSGGGNIRWFHYLQLLLFLALVAWFMKSCNM